MKYEFNLLHEPWIPCIPLHKTQSVALSLRDVFAQAPELREITHNNPLVTVAIHRLLLAILHRVFGPEDSDQWIELWERGSWESGQLEAYFDRWQDRFNLFDEHYPFYQCGNLESSKTSSVSVLFHELASGLNATLFDHTTDDLPPALSPAEAGLRLVTFQSFAVGSLVSCQPDEDPLTHRPAEAAPLVKKAVALVRGENLFRTLLLNFVRYSLTDEEPFAMEPDDGVAWERDTETTVEQRLPRGYLDLLTWQARRLKLLPEEDDDGCTVVQAVLSMKGNEFPKDSHLRHYETMVAFGFNERATGVTDPYPAVAFTPERALWRNSLALLHGVGTPRGQRTTGQAKRPTTFDWLADLAAEGIVPRRLPVDFSGMATSRAKVLLWRQEQLALPLAFLENTATGTALYESLGTALGLAETVAGTLRSHCSRLAARLLAPDSDQPGGREPLSEDIRAMTRRFAVERGYWWRLELPFKSLLSSLPEVSNEDTAPGETAVEATWAMEVLDAARTAFTEVTRSLDTSARSLKAVAQAERGFNGNLERRRRDYLHLDEEEGGVRW